MQEQMILRAIFPEMLDLEFRNGLTILLQFQLRKLGQ